MSRRDGTARVVVVGGYGVFGSRLVELLMRDGCEVWAAGRHPSRAASGIPLALDRDGDLSPLADLGPDVVVDTEARTVVRHGRPVALTFKELALLEYLVRSPGRAVSRGELMETVWHGASPADGSRTIDVHVRRLRDKLGGCPGLATVRGVGYRFDPTPMIVLVGSGDAG